MFKDIIDFGKVMSNVKRFGRPSNRCKNVQKVLYLISSDQHKFSSDVADDVGVSHWILHSILKSKMQMSKVFQQLGNTLKNFELTVP